MKAMVLSDIASIDSSPLELQDLPDPEPGPGEIRIKVRRCAICRTDLHVVEGDLEPRRTPIVPGHQAVGVVEARGAGCRRLEVGDRVGVAWLHRTCGVCAACRRGDENLCEHADFTGWTVDGGYADALTVPEDFAVALPDGIADAQAAPLLCAGVIGYRALRRAEIEPGQRVALVGFGASAHLAIQVLHHWECDVVVLTRGEGHRALARELGATWVGETDDDPPGGPTDAVVNFTPAGETVPRSLDLVRPGGTVSLAGIHMSPIPSFEYRRLWGERSLRSVANMTRRDAEELMAIAAAAEIRTETTTYPLERANDALAAIAADAVRGAAVLEMVGRPALG